MSKTVVCVGGGAASFFAAIQAKREHPQNRVILLEGTGRVLTKVRVSGGGRCNVTHNLFDLKRFASFYPRGARELLGPLHRFGPEDTIRWFKTHGVELKAEADGRMFPITNSSTTILNCLVGQAEALGVEVRTMAMVKGIKRQDNGQYSLELRDHKFTCDRLFLGTGSMPQGHQFAKQLGHTITDLAPSLFTFCIDSVLLKDLAGVAFEHVGLTLIVADPISFKQTGPVLVTHWGLSGPAILKLSAFAARELKASNYRATLLIDFMPDRGMAQVREDLLRYKKNDAKKLIANTTPGVVPARFWKQIVNLIAPDMTWAHITQQQLEGLVIHLKECRLSVVGKGEFKEEFVTCGGVKLSEINFKSMESKICPGLFLAGEILDIDGITGGFNFQNAWTGGFIAGQSM